MDDVTLYHGSKSGIVGKIRPISREDCDFGMGFYMGTIPEQTKGLVLNRPEPVFYEMKFRLSEIPEDRILILDDMEWLNMILANRRVNEEFDDLDLAKQTLEQMEQYDVIIGSIADGGISRAIESFSKGILTDEGLLTCLSYVDYGQQYVAKTQFACDKIDILSEHNITKSEKKEIRKYASEMQRKSYGLLSKVELEYRDNGMYIDEIIDNEMKKKRGLGYELD